MLFRLTLTLVFVLFSVATGHAEPTRYVRFKVDDTTAYGIVEGQRVRALKGDLFGAWSKTDKTYPLKDVKLLVPTRPSQVFAMAGNYRSHLTKGATTTIVTTTTTIKTDPKSGESSVQTTTEEEMRIPGQVPVKFQTPQPFFKSPSCLVPTGGKIVLPKDADVVHYEAEMVVVIGKKAKDVSKAEALDYVFGVACGNDISARKWQKGDVQWWRAKGSDTFGPCGPYILAGVDYDDLQLTLRLNGEVKQDVSTKMLIHDVASTVSFISQHVTLHPGDLIFTGTPGTTDVLQDGDTVEVELEGGGVLRNSVVAE